MRTIDLRTDDELVEAAAWGNRAAFEELYRRHSDAAWGVAMSVTRDRNDAADAVSDAFTRMFTAVESGRLVGVPFRPYLLTATRNASIDILRRSSRLDVTDEIDDARLSRTGAAITPADAVLAGAESALVAEAFAGLPERWRSVLWLTEVEGMAPREAAEVLGLSANGAAQLAVRARAGLRERYLQAHVGNAPSESCRFTIERLGAYVGGGLATRDLAKVDQHLAGCDECRARQAELEEVGSTLRRAIVPIPLFLGAAVLGRLHLTSSASAAVGSAGSAGAKVASGSWDGLTKALAGACAGLLALGIVGVGLKAGDDGSGGGARRLAAPPEVEGFSISRAPEAAAFVAPSAAPAIPSFDETARSVGSDATVAPSPPADAAPAPTATPSITDAVMVQPTPAAPAPQPAAAPTAAEPVAQVDAGLGGTSGLTAAAGIGDGSCTGVTVSGTGTTCAAPDPTSTEQVGVTVDVQGADPIHVGL